MMLARPTLTATITARARSRTAAPGRPRSQPVCPPETRAPRSPPAPAWRRRLGGSASKMGGPSRDPSAHPVQRGGDPLRNLLALELAADPRREDGLLGHEAEQGH